MLCVACVVMKQIIIVSIQIILPIMIYLQGKKVKLLSKIQLAPKTKKMSKEMQIVSISLCVLNS